MEFRWDIHYKCNYRCPYCYYYGRWQETLRINKYFSVKQWLDAWHRIYEKYGSAHITISGGEPTIYPAFFDLIKELSREHTLDIFTNISCSKNQLVNFLSQLNSHRLYFSTTFHPLFTSFEDFLEKVLIIKERGVLSGINYVAYPPELKRINYFKDKFLNNELYITILPFRGRYNDIVYPQGYTEEEKHLFDHQSSDSTLTKKEILDQLLCPVEAKGKLCCAGQKYAVINYDGQVYRCSHDKKILGYFFDRDFLLLHHPLSCESEICDCEFMLLVKDN